MVHNLFDEYRFFSSTGKTAYNRNPLVHLFRTTRQQYHPWYALRYVLEALGNPSPAGATTSSGKMFKFGMFALEQFKGRLHEWPGTALTSFKSSLEEGCVWLQKSNMK
jgi:hypothetical protein